MSQRIVANTLLIGTIISHYVLVGADAFAQAAIVPIALSEPPVSLAMFQGDYVYNSAPFWRAANIFALAFLVAALIANWNTDRRKLILATFIGTSIISVVSLGYIFPAFTELVSSPFSESVDPSLVERGANWRVLAGSRLVVFGLLGVLPLLALAKPLSESQTAA